ncbi:MAG TPA: hypothetical protein VLD61_08910 [Methylomirabilota bacterium]|nr:hypothetical protein [Methylomirabilota bacterium]
MKSIIVYSREVKAQNLYPKRIISPPHPNKCCRVRMEVLGRPRLDEQGRKFCYKRCRTCGFALRHFLEPVGTILPAVAPDAKARKPQPVRDRTGLVPLSAPVRRPPVVGRRPTLGRHLSRGPAKTLTRRSHARSVGRKTAVRRRR